MGQRFAEFFRALFEGGKKFRHTLAFVFYQGSVLMGNFGMCNGAS
jgi:hypothetical protein